MEIKNKIIQLDGIEVLKVTNQKVDFPEHYHDTFCISLIEKGVETIQMGDNVLLSEKGAISINNPYEIHANPLLDKNITNDFTTIYLSPDVADFFTGEKDVNFSHQQMNGKEMIELFNHVVRAIVHSDVKRVESSLQALLSSFSKKTKLELNDLKFSNQQWLELMSLIEHSLGDKITLDFLARFMNMDKYNFAKKFRAKYGLSPINYVLMKKVFRAKELITETTNLTQLAYQFDFADQAHFSKHFKRFVGVSPRAYKKQLH